MFGQLAVAEVQPEHVDARGDQLVDLSSPDDAGPSVATIFV